MILLLLACSGKPEPVDTHATDSADEPGDSTAPLDCFRDVDGDGYGDGGAPADCHVGVVDGTDCDDSASSVHPGAGEVCNGEDEDCDGTVDEDPVDGLPYYRDADGDGYGSETTTACAWAEGLVLDGGDCDDTNVDVHPGATEHCDDVDDDCDGVASDSVGASSECPADSCLAALAAGVTTDGATWITLPSGQLVETWCDQTTDGGGWTLGFVRNSASTESQPDFGSGDVGTDALGQSPGAASLSSTPAMGWIDLDTFNYETLRLAAYASGGETYLSRDIPRTELRIAFSEDGYKLYGGTTGYYWCGGAASYTDSGVGAVNNPSGASADCKGHGSVGSGWDFSEYDYPNAGLTLCGGDASAFLAASWGGTWSYYGTPGGAEAIWVR